MQSTNRKWKILAVFLLLLGVVLVALIYSQDNKDEDIDNRYKDPLTDQEVSSPKGKTPESFGTNSDLPLFLGFEELLDNGMSYQQLGGLKTAFYNFSKSRPKKIKEISLDVKKIELRHDSTDPNSKFNLHFNVRTDRENNYAARVRYYGLTSIRLYLLDLSTSKVVFDSGIIKPRVIRAPS